MHKKAVMRSPADHAATRATTIIETDLTMLIPNSYVSETAERLALYRRLVDIKDEAELQRFTAEITDRFGPIPQQVTELMEAIRLRWLGQQMGLEKMVLKMFHPASAEGHAHRHLQRRPEARLLRERCLSSHCRCLADTTAAVQVMHRP